MIQSKIDRLAPRIQKIRKAISIGWRTSDGFYVKEDSVLAEIINDGTPNEWLAHAGVRDKDGTSGSYLFCYGKTPAKALGGLEREIAKSFQDQINVSRKALKALG